MGGTQSSGCEADRKVGGTHPPERLAGWDRMGFWVPEEGVSRPPHRERVPEEGVSRPPHRERLHPIVSQLLRSLGDGSQKRG